MEPRQEYYSLNLSRKNIFNFISPAFGCTPNPPTSEETITDIQIFSDKAYNSNYSSEDNLAGIVDIFVLYRDSGYHRYALKNFIENENPVPDNIIFLLNSAPTSAEIFQFTINYYQDGLDLDEYQFTTTPIIITN
ncbi:hypothetical protein G3570_07820 [Balneolaceae bacterium YR4-1]|uniref:Uncharacterized protein n=1 Tax=Halalkalibaculum roseum TaxID=2709311 RepID=A0A6M1T3H4_9BACT|nr:hypothetical protein [Halalkalibaculum roseum]NGP76535.1 hypothetical protein [Halalkalibaculum roseum]